MQQSRSAPSPAAFIAATNQPSTPASELATGPVAAEPAVVSGEAPTTAPATGIDLAAGEEAFKACKACNDIRKGGKNGTGPNLWGVVGQPAANLENFKYSQALIALKSQVWDRTALDAFLCG